MKEFLERLTREFEARKANNKRYSLRAFAAFLNATNLSSEARDLNTPVGRSIRQVFGLAGSNLLALASRLGEGTARRHYCDRREVQSDRMMRP